MSKKILITGGTGFIGYHLAKKCLSYGWSVTSISTKKPSKYRKLKNVNYLICDIANKKNLQKKIDQNFNYVVNLAGYVDHSNRQKTLKSHYNGCKNLASIFLNKKINKFIQIGSSVEYGNIKSPQKEDRVFNKKLKSIYGESKLLSTNFLLGLFKKFNFPVIVLRLYLVYGPNQDINRVVPITIYNSLLNKKFECSSGKQLRDFIYIDDLINAIIKALNNKKVLGEIINIGSGNPIKVKELILKICKQTKLGKPIFGKIKFRKDEIVNLYPNIKKAKKYLGWYPKIKLDNGLKKTIIFFKNKKK